LKNFSSCSANLWNSCLEGLETLDPLSLLALTESSFPSKVFTRSAGFYQLRHIVYPRSVQRDGGRPESAPLKSAAGHRVGDERALQERSSESRPWRDPELVIPSGYRVRCRRRPGRKPCGGYIEVDLDPDTDDIVWWCATNGPGRHTGHFISIQGLMTPLAREPLVLFHLIDVAQGRSQWPATTNGVAVVRVVIGEDIDI
jgi:hypothetical protein